MPGPNGYARHIRECNYGADHGDGHMADIMRDRLFAKPPLMSLFDSSSTFEIPPLEYSRVRKWVDLDHQPLGHIKPVALFLMTL